jgi:MYXO-CTERM domain-containing protein
VRAQLLAIARPPAPPRARCAEGAWDAGATDAGASDASAIDADLPATDATVIDATVASDVSAQDDAPDATSPPRDGALDAASDSAAPSLRAGGGCQCSATSTTPRPSHAGIAAALAFIWGFRRRTTRRTSVVFSDQA